MKLINGPPVVVRGELGLDRGQLEDARWLGRELFSRGAELARAIEELSDMGAVADQELMDQLRELRDSLAEVTARQADLRDRTNAVRDEAQAALSQEARQRMDELFEELIRDGLAPNELARRHAKRPLYFH